MNYPIPTNPEEIKSLSSDFLVDEEVIAAALAGVIKIARLQGQSLDQLTQEVLLEDSLLDNYQRRCLNDILIEAWQTLS